MRSCILVLVFLACVPLLSGEALLGAANFVPSRKRPVGWRGDGSGLIQGHWPGATPPAQWGFKRRDEITAGTKIPGLKWKVLCPNQTIASVIVVGDKVITHADPQTILAYAVADGKLLWHNAADQLDIIPGITPAKAKEIRALWRVVDPLFGKYNLAPVEKTKKRGSTPERENAANRKRFMEAVNDEGTLPKMLDVVLDRARAGEPGCCCFILGHALAADPGLKTQLQEHVRKALSQADVQQNT